MCNEELEPFESVVVVLQLEIHGRKLVDDFNTVRDHEMQLLERFKPLTTTAPE